MESILGKILLGAAAVAAGADPEKMADEINTELEKVSVSLKKERESIGGIKGIRADEDAMDEAAADRLSDQDFAKSAKETNAFRLCSEHRAGAEKIETTIIGHGVDVLVGAVSILSSVAKSTYCGDKLVAVGIVRSICDSALHEILSGGGYRRCAGCR